MRFSAAAFFLSMVAAASATVYITSPVAGTVFTAGQNSTINWKDDGSSPSLQQFGPSKVSIYVGNSQQQTSLQLIVSNVDVSKTDAIVFIPDGSIGPTSPNYFIRIESLSLKDATNPQYPALSFSPKFTLNGATGQFTPAEISQINAASSVGGPAGASTPVSTPVSTPISSPSSTPHSSSKTSSGTSPSSTTKQNSGEALSISSGKFAAGVLAGVVGLAMLL